MFFLFVLSGLVMIFILFKPLDIKEQKFVDVPLFEIVNFVMHELTSEGLKTFMTGDKTLRYTDRYTVKNIDFTDDSKGHISNMKADRGLYKDDIVDLDGNISYVREDGLAFESQTMTYNTTTSIAKTDSDYVAFRGKSTMKGSSLEYNSVKNKIKSDNVFITYRLKEEN